MGKIAEQIGMQVARLEESTSGLSRFIGAIVNSYGGSVKIKKEELKKIMEKTDWYLDIQEEEEGEVIKFIFVDESKDAPKKVLLS